MTNNSERLNTKISRPSPRFFVTDDDVHSPTEYRDAPKETSAEFGQGPNATTRSVNRMKTLDIVSLLNTPSIGRKTVHYICEHYKQSISSADELLDVIIDAKKSISRIKIPDKEAFFECYDKAAQIIELSRANGIEILGITDPLFPNRYRAIPDAPVVIHAKGNVHALNIEKTVAIVGTREPTEFGIKAGERLSSIFAKHQFAVVSGLAIGCDTVAHLGCLNAGGITVAIMARGLDKIYPSENTALAHRILDSNGCWVSEYPFGMPPLNTYFVDRDRLQSGLSQAVVVIETDIRGGTMHTVGFAIKQNRYLGCLSGHPDKFSGHAKVQGNIELLREGKAKSLGSAAEIDDFIKLLAENNLEHPIPR